MGSKMEFEWTLALIRRREDAMAGQAPALSRNPESFRGREGETNPVAGCSVRGCVGCHLREWRVFELQMV